MPKTEKPTAPRLLRALQPITLADGTILPTGAVHPVEPGEAAPLIAQGVAAWYQERPVEASPQPPPGA